MNCDDARQLLLLAGYGELSFEEEEALELHVASCPECQSVRARNASLETLLAQAELDPPPGLLARCRRDFAVRIGEESAPARRFSPASSGTVGSSIRPCGSGQPALSPCSLSVSSLPASFRRPPLSPSSPAPLNLPQSPASALSMRLIPARSAFSMMRSASAK